MMSPTAEKGQGDVIASGSSQQGTSNSNKSSEPVVAKKCLSDYKFGKTIGEGSFSTVFLARDKSNPNTELAIKVCEKLLIQKERKQAAIMREKEILQILNNHPSPFFVKFIASFQDSTRLYFVLTYARYGELLTFIRRHPKQKPFDLECTRFYSAEIILALEHLHGLGIVHRDLKPENILLDDRMHIQITDFGSAMIEEPSKFGLQSPSQVEETPHLRDGEEPAPYARRIKQGSNRRSSFVGTAQYVSPEILTSKTASKACDVWALGCIMYQMISGTFPFKAATEFLIFRKIQELDYSFPQDFDDDAKSLVKSILVIEPEDRLGIRSFDQTGRYEDIRNHEFFRDMTGRWSTLCDETSPLPIPENHCHKADLFPEIENLDPGFPGFIGTSTSRDISRNERDWVTNPSDPQFKIRLEKQAKENEYHNFVEGNLILRQGILEKTREFRPKKKTRMFLLTTGPKLFYVDPVKKVLKGQVPWSASLHPEAKNFKHFFIHTPGRSYILDDPASKAPSWVSDIEEVKRIYYDNGKEAVNPPATLGTTASVVSSENNFILTTSMSAATSS